MNATHLGCAPEREAVPIDWSSVDPGCGVVDGIAMLVQLVQLVHLVMQLSNFWTGIVAEEGVFRRALEGFRRQVLMQVLARRLAAIQGRSRGSLWWG